MMDQCGEDASPTEQDHHHMKEKQSDRSWVKRMKIDQRRGKKKVQVQVSQKQRSFNRG